MARPRKQDRKKRVPLGSPHRKMTVQDVPNDKVARWINDKPGRLQSAQEGGYEFVRKNETETGEGAESSNSDLGSYISQVVGTHESGEPMRAYLMMIDKDTYKSDQKEKQKEVDKVDKAIAEGRLQNSLGQKGYIPESGISIKRDT
ncbi:MAG: hypothetical protein KGY70_14490 [Bacteroidales bacterium]|nr:hypothetical protein [Bacteroidales bacterium]